jgi:lysophospholipase
MGALVALSMAPQLSNRIERMVLTAPFIELSNQPLPTWSLRMLTRLMRMIGLGWVGSAGTAFQGRSTAMCSPRISNGSLATSALYSSIPSCGSVRPALGWISEMLNAMKSCH